MSREGLRRAIELVKAAFILCAALRMADREFCEKLEKKALQIIEEAHREKQTQKTKE